MAKWSYLIDGNTEKILPSDEGKFAFDSAFELAQHLLTEHCATGSGTPSYKVGDKIKGCWFIEDMEKNIHEVEVAEITEHKGEVAYLCYGTDKDEWEVLTNDRLQDLNQN